MSEMLGNQYFMARNYSDAMNEFEEVIAKYPSNKSVKKKLIICYSQNGKIEKALDYFFELGQEDIEFIINTDPIADDCPCSELVKNYEKGIDLNQNSADFHLLLGITWLYCDVQKSLEYLKIYSRMKPNENRIPLIIDRIELYLQSNPA